MVKKIIFPLMLVALLLTACAPAAAAPRSENAKGVAAGGAPSMAPAPMAPAAPVAADQSTVANAVPAEPSGVRIVLMNAELAIIVPDPAKSMSVISQMANDMGGFVVSSNLYKTNTDSGIEVPEAAITVRVPAARLTEAMDKIKAMVSDKSTDVISENVTGQDVTREYTDLKSRLGNLEQTAARLKEIMASATRTEDVLAVNNQLMQITEQIEVLKGQIKYYDEASSLSAIAVRLQAEASIEPLTVGGWKPVGVARDALQALINTLKVLGNITIYGLILCLPLGIILAIPVVIVWKVVQSIRRKRKAIKAAADAPVETPEKK
jgi:hypothetical protein